MPYCPNCGQEVDQDATECFMCGQPIPPGEAKTGYDPGRPGEENGGGMGGPSPTEQGPYQGQAQAPGEISRDEWLAYVGKKASYYFPRFAKFSKTGRDRLAVTWHWPALFVPFWWFIYRKMYIWAGVVALLAFVPYVNLALWLASALTANYIYYKDAKRKILAVKRAYPDQDVTGILAQAGAVHRWIPWVAIVVTVIMVGVIFLGAMGAVVEMDSTSPMPQSAEPISS